MAHTNVQLVSGNLTTGQASPTFFIDRANDKVGIGGVPDITGDNSSNVLQVTGNMLATRYHGDGSNLTGLSDSKWLEYSGDATKIYYNGGNVGIGVTDPGSKLEVNGTVTATTFSGALSGNASTASSADTLTTPRDIGGVSFDGSASIDLPGVNTEGTQNTTGTANAITSQANSATITASVDAGDNTIVRRHSDGYIFSNYINTTDNAVTSGVVSLMCKQSNDYHRSASVGAVRSFLGLGDYAYKGNGSNITRTSFSNGYMIGYQNGPSGGSDAKTNPIYTIGTSHLPTDTSLGNMYGIGYSHGNFTSILTGGWGMYVASDGDARIGLNAQHGNIKCTGYITAGGNVTAYSDIRGKENIKRIENPLERIEKMNGYIYNKKEEPTKKYTGVVAQELLEVLPEVVEGNEKDGYAVAYGNFAGIFIEAIKELKAQLQVEKSRNDRLEALMTTFNSRLDNVN